MLIAASTMTRPADTTAYAAGDLVANSTTAASVTPFSFSLSALQGREMLLVGFTLRKSGSTVTDARFGLHLFKASPTVATTGDNGVFASVVSGVGDAIGYMEFSSMKGFADGARGYGVPDNASFRLASLFGASTIYGLLEARAAYTPASAETFTPVLMFLPVD